jgi:hypothetical protein
MVGAAHFILTGIQKHLNFNPVTRKGVGKRWGAGWGGVPMPPSRDSRIWKWLFTMGNTKPYYAKTFILVCSPKHRFNKNKWLILQINYCRVECIHSMSLSRSDVCCLYWHWLKVF